MSGFDEAAVASLLGDDAFAGALGVELVHVDDGAIVVALDLSDAHANFLGAAHGGVVFSLADCALSLASNSAGSAVAIDAHIVLSAASRPGDRLEARVVEMSRGRTLGTYRVDVTRGDGRQVALFTGTVFIDQG